MSEIQEIRLKYPESESTHSLFYKKISDLEISVFNPPLTDSQDSLKQIIEQTFLVFGYIDSVSISGSSIQVKFSDEKGMMRALLKKQKTNRSLPPAYSGVFGVDYYKNLFKDKRPSIDVLERISTTYIKSFEDNEKAMREASGSSRHVVKMTEAEKQEIIRKYQEKTKQMMSSDFYGFQQKDRPSLATALLAPVKPEPRHLKKQPKKNKRTNIETKQK